MKRLKFKAPKVTWDMVGAWRRNKETWKQISARLGGVVSPELLRAWAAKLGKRKLLGHALGRGKRADWKLIAKLIRAKKSYDYTAKKVGLSSGLSLYTMVERRRKQGRWSIPPPPRDRRAACLKGVRRRRRRQREQVALHGSVLAAPRPSVKRWRPFKHCREYVRTLGLRTVKDWRTFSKSGKRPWDIPSEPFRVYAESWRGMADFLGNPMGRNRRTYQRRWRPFKEACVFVRSLGLRHREDWRAFACSERRPRDIPSNPEFSYSGEFNGIADFLGCVGLRRTEFAKHPQPKPLPLQSQKLL